MIFLFKSWGLAYLWKGLSSSTWICLSMCVVPISPALVKSCSKILGHHVCNHGNFLYDSLARVSFSHFQKYFSIRKPTFYWKSLWVYDMCELDIDPVSCVLFWNFVLWHPESVFWPILAMCSSGLIQNWDCYWLEKVSWTDSWKKSLVISSRGEL